MRNSLITTIIVWGCGFFLASNVASAVDAKLDAMQDDSFCN